MSDSIALDGIAGGPIEQTRASDSARRFIRSLIYTGELGPGDLLPPERELAAQLRISRITLREALKGLESGGYLVTKVGAKGGTRVADVAALKSCFYEWLRTQTDELESLLEFHRIVEVSIASLAAERRTDEDLERLAAARIPPHPTRSVALRHHRSFHEALGHATHNSFLEKASVQIYRQVFVPIDYLMDGPLDEFRAEHDRLYDAVRDRDASRAADEMSRHFVGPRAWAELLEKVGQPANETAAQQAERAAEEERFAVRARSARARQERRERD
jgi:GntR family transcriptional repressor for pyruvate dehydrogenase complex